MKKFVIFLLLICCCEFKVCASNLELKLNAKNALLYDLTYDKILYEKDIYTEIPNASTTKILTAIVAYENSNMEDIVEISEKAVSVNGSKINLRKGDKVKMDSLMKGLLISSGNDAAIAIAEHVGGNVEMFCDMMNDKARALGGEHTNFVTPHGLDNENHYTTVSDLLIFSKYFMQIPYLREIANTEKIIVKIDNYEKELYATNEMLFIYDDVNGIKTGYTNNAGRCLITSINSGDRELVTMVLGCDSKIQRTEDTKKLITYGYEQFEEIDICDKLQKNFEIRIKKAINNRIRLTLKGTKKILLEKGKKGDLEYIYEMPKTLTAPVKSGEVIGRIKICMNGEILSEILVEMPYSIEKKKALQYFCDILLGQNLYIEIKS